MGGSTERAGACTAGSDAGAARTPGVIAEVDGSGAGSAAGALACTGSSMGAPLHSAAL